MKSVDMVDLFGEKITIRVSESKRPETNRKGYAATPGTGPSGETCKTCAHSRKCNSGSAKQFYKCVLVKHIWTRSYGTDILARSPACRLWEKDDGST